MIIDTNRRTTARLACLHEQGVRSIIRYYARTTQQPEKRLTREEAEAIVASGKSIGMVHQAGGANVGSFSAQRGKEDAEYAIGHAITVIGQPAGSAIYFAVDFDCSPAQVTSNILPHFRAINDVNNSGQFSKQFVIGAYGNGAALERLLDEGLVTFAWLSQSTGHHGSAAFKNTDRWTLFQNLPSTMCQLDLDVDQLHPNLAGFGQFSSLDPAAVAGGPGTGAGGTVPAMRFRTTAASGLRLRSGPGTEFDVVRMLPLGTIVTAVGFSGDWVIVDLTGDGNAEGAVHRSFLAPV